MDITLPEWIIFITWLVCHSACAMPLGAAVFYLAMTKVMPWTDERARNKRLEQLIKAQGGPEA